MRRPDSRPEVVYGLALRDRYEHVYDVENQDDRQNGPYHHVLPLLRADPEQEDADCEFEEDRGQDVGDLAEPTGEQSIGKICKVDGS